MVPFPIRAGCVQATTQRHQTAPKMFLSTQPAWEPDTALTARAVIHPPQVHQGQRPLTSLVTGETFHNFPPDLPADVPTRGVRCPSEPGHRVAWVAALRSFTTCILEKHSLLSPPPSQLSRQGLPRAVFSLLKETQSCQGGGVAPMGAGLSTQKPSG